MEFACGLAGLILVTANPSYQTAELRYVLEQSGASALFSVESHRGNPMSEIAAAAADGLGAVREIVDLEDPDALFRIGGRPAGAARRYYAPATRRRSSTLPARPVFPRVRCCRTVR